MVPIMIPNLYRLYGFVQGNVTKKELDFRQVLSQNFSNGAKLESLITLVQSGKLSLLNGKEISYQIIDGDLRDPEVIAREKGVLSEGDGPSTSSLNFDGFIEEVLTANKSTVDKIRESGKDGPVMFLVGQVMKKTNKQGDPQEI